jgi:glucose/arabinose dehydrogenase
MNRMILKLSLVIGVSLVAMMSFRHNLVNRALSARGVENFPRRALTEATELDSQLALADVIIGLNPVALGFSRPVQVTHAGDGSGRLFVVEQEGNIRIIKNGVVLPTPFLNIQTSVLCCGERGLLGLAFHLDYETNGYFYINYTREQPVADGATVIARYSVSGTNPDLADTGTAQTILTIAQPDSNHNGGQLLFGPDGYLYIAMGDGGGANDPGNNGQNKNTLLGAMLRIDIDNPTAGNNYGIPPDNPYVGVDGADEIWAIGLRNPWRFSFDRLTGDIYIGDVGQGAWEEIDFQAAGTPGGLNFGWDIREGFCPTGQTTLPCSPAPPQFTDPIVAYGRTQGDRTVTGGFVYRGQLYGRMVGHYFYADYISGRIWSIEKTGPNSWTFPEEEANETFNISSFGEDEAGELYVVDYSGGRILQLIDATGPSPLTNVYYFPMMFKN